MTTAEADTSAAADSAPTTTFSTLGLSDAVLKALRDVGYETPSAIQAATIPTLLAGRDATLEAALAWIARQPRPSAPSGATS